MKDDKISRAQLAALLWAGVLAPAAELLPALLLPRVGGGAWLAVLGAAPVVLAVEWLVNRAAGDRGLGRGILELLGPAAGRGLLLIYIVWSEVLLALRLRLCAQRLLDVGERDGSLGFFLLGTATVVLWMGVGRLPAFARAGQLFLAALLCTAAVVLGLSLPQVQPERLLPQGGWEGGSLLKAALSAAGVLCWGLPAGFLTGSAEKETAAERRRGLFRGCLGCILLAGAQGVILGSLGACLAGKVARPFFTLAKSIGVEGAFQRVEGLIAVLWTFADLTMAGVLVFALRAMAEAFAPGTDSRIPAAGGVLLAAALALMGLPAWSRAGQWGWEMVSKINLLLALAVPGFLCVLRWARKK